MIGILQPVTLYIGDEEPGENPNEEKNSNPIPEPDISIALGNHVTERTQMSWPGHPGQEVGDRTQGPGQNVPSQTSESGHDVLARTSWLRRHFDWF